MEEEPTLEKLLELGDRKIAAGEPDLAIHYCNLALKKDLQNPRANFQLAEACRLKAETGGPVYYTLAAEPLRRILNNDPRNEAAHEKLTVLAVKTDALDALAREYGEKLKDDPADGFYARHLKRVYILALLDRGMKVKLPQYKPVLYIKSFFDFLVLPAGMTAVILANFGRKFKPFLPLGAALFLFYLLYRGMLYALMRGK